MKIVHILWDWNGTLLDDTNAALGALNDMLVRRGKKALTMEFYKENFAFPVRPFYERIGLFDGSEDWDDIAREYHEVYAKLPKELNVETIAALEKAKSLGYRQSIISALRQDLLESDLNRFGIANYFDYVYGTDNLDGASKLDRAKELMMKLTNERVIVIGDALHDYEVAEAIGAKTILCSQGGHSAHRLEAVAPTGHTLLAAIDLITSSFT